MTDDNKLIKHILKGDKPSMDLLINKYYKLVYAYVYRKIGDYHMSYDITQEIFIKMAKSIDTFNNKSSFKNWLMRIAVNHCNDYYRSKYYKSSINLQELDFSMTDTSNNTWQTILQKLNTEELKLVISKLPPYQKDVLLLKYFQDLKIKDIAVITGTNQSTVKSRLRQGIKKLQDIMEGDFYEYK